MPCRFSIPGPSNLLLHPMEITGVSRWNPHVGRDIGGVNLKIASHGALAKMGPFLARKTTRNDTKPGDFFMNNKNIDIFPGKLFLFEHSHMAWLRMTSRSEKIWDMTWRDVWGRTKSGRNREKQHVSNLPHPNAIIQELSDMSCQYAYIWNHFIKNWTTLIIYCRNLVNQKRSQIGFTIGYSIPPLRMIYSPKWLIIGMVMFPFVGPNHMIQWPEMRLKMMGCSPKNVVVNRHCPIVFPQKRAASKKNKRLRSGSAAVCFGCSNHGCLADHFWKGE